MQPRPKTVLTDKYLETSELFGRPKRNLSGWRSVDNGDAILNR